MFNAAWARWRASWRRYPSSWRLLSFRTFPVSRPFSVRRVFPFPSLVKTAVMSLGKGRLS